MKQISLELSLSIGAENIGTSEEDILKKLSEAVPEKLGEFYVTGSRPVLVEVGPQEEAKEKTVQAVMVPMWRCPGCQKVKGWEVPLDHHENCECGTFYRVLPPI